MCARLKELESLSLSCVSPPKKGARAHHSERESLDDIVTQGIRRTRSVPQGDPCAADLFGAALDTPAAMFCEMCQNKKWRLPVGNGHLGLPLVADNCWIIAMSAGELQTVANAWNELLKSSGLQDCLGIGGVVLDGTRQSGSKHHCVGTNKRRMVQSKGSVVHVRWSLHERINWLSVRYPRGDVSMRYDNCCLTTMWL